MTFVFDSSALITAHRNELPFTRFQPFWDWMSEQAERGEITFPSVVLEECSGTDKLACWLEEHAKPYKISDNQALPYLQKVLLAYGANIEAKDLGKIENDAIVIAHAMAMQEADKRVGVVTCERRNNATRPGNMSMPNVCEILEITWFSLPAFLWTHLHSTFNGNGG